jgi:hypothetical protein
MLFSPFSPPLAAAIASETLYCCSTDRRDLRPPASRVVSREHTGAEFREKAVVVVVEWWG